mmetsp:Transcript_92580/g.211998  ORF Transcript_92580/g.211998 Transcript_92580/m.211998 type:complete len:239 (+) Transcript_92580:55-771(+)
MACNVDTTCPAWQPSDTWTFCSPSCGPDRITQQVVRCVHEGVVVPNGNCTGYKPEKIEACDAVACCTPETCTGKLKASLGLSATFSKQTVIAVILPSLAVVCGVEKEAVVLVEIRESRRLSDSVFQVDVEISVQDAKDGTRVAGAFKDFPGERYAAVAKEKAEEEELGEEILELISGMDTVTRGEPQVEPPPAPPVEEPVSTDSMNSTLVVIIVCVCLACLACFCLLGWCCFRRRRAG